MATGVLPLLRRRGANAPPEKGEVAGAEVEANEAAERAPGVGQGPDVVGNRQI